ncbi:DUF211 domain-containing protein [Kaarinaea lacus]
MIEVTRLVLDILKPHHPTILDFAKGIASLHDDWTVTVNVVEMDEQTQTLEAIIEGTEINLEEVTETISEMGGSLHSVDSVQVIHVKHE